MAGSRTPRHIAVPVGAAVGARPAPDPGLCPGDPRGRARYDRDQPEELVSARIGRQAIFDRPAPPKLWAKMDEAVLHRLIGSRKIMHAQLLHLADMFCHPSITVQIVPARAGAHAGLLGGFAIASIDSSPDIVYLETSADGQVLGKSSVVAKATLRFNILRAVALPRDDSRDLILKVAEERWTE